MSEEVQQSASLSLREFDDLAGRLHFHLAPPQVDPVVLVEGKADEFALSPIVGRENVFIAGSRSRVSEVGARLWELGDTGFVCVYDSDFDSGADFVACEFACHPYEGIDLENTVLEMGDAERVVEALASEQKLTSSGGPERIVDKARQAVAPLSSLRRANAVNQWGLPFEQVDLDKYIGEDGSLDTDKYLRALLQKRSAAASSAPPSVQDLQIAAQRSCATGVYRGRDILQILAKYLRMTFLRQKKNMGASPEALEAMVHVAASSVLSLTEWAAELQRITGSKRVPAH